MLGSFECDFRRITETRSCQVGHFSILVAFLLVRYLVEQGCAKPLCDLLSSADNKVIQVALDALDNILRVGEMELINGANQMALTIEVAEGLEKINNLQFHDNEEIYKKAYHIIDKYFSNEDEETGLAPEVDEAGQFTFAQEQMNVPQGGFTFGGN